MPDFSSMTPVEFAAWQQEQNNPPVGGNVTMALPPPAPAQNTPRPAAEVWGSTTYDFVCPSGAQCRMRKLMPEQLIAEGILDKITALPGYAAEVIEQAEGLPPKPQAENAIPTKDELKSITQILEVLIPLVVVEPRVYAAPAEGEPREIGRIYTDSIELNDRIAIMERAVHGVKKFENFRPGSSQPV